MFQIALLSDLIFFFLLPKTWRGLGTQIMMAFLSDLDNKFDGNILQYLSQYNEL